VHREHTSSRLFYNVFFRALFHEEGQLLLQGDITSTPSTRSSTHTSLILSFCRTHLAHVSILLATSERRVGLSSNDVSALVILLACCCSTTCQSIECGDSSAFLAGSTDIHVSPTAMPTRNPTPFANRD